MALKPLQADPNYSSEIDRLSQDPDYFGDGTASIRADAGLTEKASEAPAPDTKIEADAPTDKPLTE